MAESRQTARKRLLQAALDLFAAQGFTETTTRQIAEQASVNEVTLFRNFGSKHGLLLAVIKDAEAVTQLGDVLGQQQDQASDFGSAVLAYSEEYLVALDRIGEFVRSLVGEAGQYPPENRQAIADGLQQVHRFTAEYLGAVAAREPMAAPLPVSKIGDLLNVLLLGYALMELTTEFHGLWPSRSAFITDVASLLTGSVRPHEIGGPLPAFVSSDQEEDPMVLGNTDTPATAANPSSAADLPREVVRTILQKARKTGVQEYAIAYVLFGAGLNLQEMLALQRLHSVSSSQQHVLYLADSPRQVLLNQWIMGYRYGTYVKNPLTQWLKSRKDDEPAMFINGTGEPMTETDLLLRWQALTLDILTPAGYPPDIAQSQHTWCVEMLMRGMEPQALSLLTGWSLEKLQPHMQRAQAGMAVEQALKLDQKPGKLEED